MPGVRTVNSLDCLVLSNLIKQSYITARKHFVALFHAAALLSSTWFTKNQFCVFEHLVQISKEDFSWKYVNIKSYSNIHIKQEWYSNAYILNVNHESWSWNGILSGGKNQWWEPCSFISLTVHRESGGAGWVLLCNKHLKFSRERGCADYLLTPGFS